MKKKEMKNVRTVGDEIVTEDELRETMHMAGSYCWNKIHQHMCCEEGCMFPMFLEAVWSLSAANKELSIGLVCMMLKEAGEEDFAADLTSVCLEDGLAMDCFLNSFNEIFEDYLYGEREVCETPCEDEDEDDDEIESEFDEEMLDEPVLEVSIKVNNAFLPDLQKQMEDIFRTLGVPVPAFMKEAEDDE